MSLKRQLSSSTAWMSLAASGMSLVSFLVFIIISRILSPNEIGLVVFAILVVELGKIVVNGGITIAIVQRKEWDNTHASTCFYLSLIYGAIFTGLVLTLGAKLTHDFYDPAAVPILQVLAAIFIIEAVKVVHEGKLRREFLFKVIALRSILASTISGVVGVTLALQGYGVWALVAQQLVGQVLITTVTLVSAHWWPSLRFSFALAKETLGFSSPMMVANFIYTLCNTLLDFMVGIILGPIALGIYRIAGRALFILQDIIIRPMEQTVFPALARLNDKLACAEATLRIMRMSCFVIVPIFFGTAAVAAEFIELVFGEKWRASGALMSMLAIGSTPLVVRLQVNAALTAQGQSRWVMFSTISTLLIILTIGYFAIPHGVTYAALAYIAVNYLTGIISLLIFYRVFGCRLLAIFNALWPSYLASAIMLAACLALKHELPGSLPSTLQIILICATGGLVYLLLGLLVFRQETRNFLQEGLSVAPAKFSPLLLRLQGWLRLQ
ncbi:MAG TPA: lipopolysaccharide biosynthesis protein [Cellvibrio sp.]|nr:lipopolysaccharide biosynthesis protein [Cellvibrio sp.]